MLFCTAPGMICSRRFRAFRTRVGEVFAWGSLSSACVAERACVNADGSSSLAFWLGIRSCFVCWLLSSLAFRLGNVCICICCIVQAPSH